MDYTLYDTTDNAGSNFRVDLEQLNMRRFSAETKSAETRESIKAIEDSIAHLERKRREEQANLRQSEAQVKYLLQIERERSAVDGVSKRRSWVSHWSCQPGEDGCSRTGIASVIYGYKSAEPDEAVVRRCEFCKVYKSDEEAAKALFWNVRQSPDGTYDFLGSRPRRELFPEWMSRPQMDEREMEEKIIGFHRAQGDRCYLDIVKMGLGALPLAYRLTAPPSRLSGCWLYMALCDFARIEGGTDLMLAFLQENKYNEDYSWAVKETAQVLTKYVTENPSLLLTVSQVLLDDNLASIHYAIIEALPRLCASETLVDGVVHFIVTQNTSEYGVEKQINTAMRALARLGEAGITAVLALCKNNKNTVIRRAAYVQIQNLSPQAEPVKSQITDMAIQRLGKETSLPALGTLVQIVAKHDIQSAMLAILALWHKTPAMAVKSRSGVNGLQQLILTKVFENFDTPECVIATGEVMKVAPTYSFPEAKAYLLATRHKSEARQAAKCLLGSYYVASVVIGLEVLWRLFMENDDILAAGAIIKEADEIVRVHGRSNELKTWYINHPLTESERFKILGIIDEMIAIGVDREKTFEVLDLYSLERIARHVAHHRTDEPSRAKGIELIRAIQLDKSYTKEGV